MTVVIPEACMVAEDSAKVLSEYLCSGEYRKVLSKRSTNVEWLLNREVLMLGLIQKLYEQSRDF